MTEVQSTTASHNVRNSRVSVIGAARSGVAVAELLVNAGAKVFVTDKNAVDALGENPARLNALGVPFETDGHTDRVYDADLIVVSPGVPTDAPVLREAEAKDIRIVSELELASWFCPAPILAITGTNGKTTVTALAGRMFHDGKKKHVVGGNIGTAFSQLIPEITPDSTAILEVSSFQLDTIESFHPKVSVLLNITPDHLDRYELSFEKYMAAKCRVFENQTKDDILVYNFEDEETREAVRRMASQHVRTLPFGVDQQYDEGAFVEDDVLVTVIDGKRSEIVPTADITIKGVHNLYNAMAATLSAQSMGVSVPSIRATLKNFKGVEHRLEFVRELNGVRYVNDSKATNVDSVWYALQAYPNPIVLLLGGRDKGNDYTRLYDLVQEHVKAIVAIGESADIVDEEFGRLVQTVRAGSIEEAVATARSLASPGDMVLLSPACASFDWFKNYEHRGNVFKELVNNLH